MSTEIAASYGRTSQERDDAFSVDSQIKANRAFGEANNLMIPSEYEFREDFTARHLIAPVLSNCAS